VGYGGGLIFLMFIFFELHGGFLLLHCPGTLYA